MSVSMMMKKREIEGSSGFMHALSSVCIDSKEAFKGDDGFFGFQKGEKMISCSSSSSSIGKNSDVSQGSIDKNDDFEEVQSSYKGPLSSMDALEQVLPFRKGISRFYNGKSKSFTSLREASTSSSVAKPDNVYIKKRRNILACNIGWDKKKGSGFISKRVATTTHSSTTTLALAAAMNCCSSSSTSSGLSNICESNTNSYSTSPPPPFVSRLNPHFKYGSSNNLSRGNWRSFSLADLHHSQFVSVTPTTTTTTKLEKEEPI